MHLISLVYWNVSKRQRGRTFACLWRIKEEYSLTWEVKNLWILSMLMESNDCSGFFFFRCTYKISWQRWIDEIWMLFWGQPKPMISFPSTELHDTCNMLLPIRCVAVIDRGVRQFLILCCFTKDPFIMSFWLLVQRSCGKVKLSLSQLESRWGWRGPPAHWHN